MLEFLTILFEPVFVLIGLIGLIAFSLVLKLWPGKTDEWIFFWLRNRLDALCSGPALILSPDSPFQPKFSVPQYTVHKCWKMRGALFIQVIGIKKFVRSERGIFSEIQKPHETGYLLQRIADADRFIDLTGYLLIFESVLPVIVLDRWIVDDKAVIDRHRCIPIDWPVANRSGSRWFQSWSEAGYSGGQPRCWQRQYTAWERRWNVSQSDDIFDWY